MRDGTGRALAYSVSRRSRAGDRQPNCSAAMRRVASPAMWPSCRICYSNDYLIEEFIKPFCAFARFAKSFSDESTTENIDTRIPVRLTAAVAYFQMRS